MSTSSDASRSNDTLAHRLRTLAYNLWWIWNPEAQDIFRQLSPLTWERSNHNPIEVLRDLSEGELHARLRDPDFEKPTLAVLRDFDEYMNRKETWATIHAGSIQRPIAYLSAEFGLHESLPIYSGGLGVLSGDHLKSASDLGLPFIGIGLFYRHGYFQQRVGPDGWQQEVYPESHPDRLPISLVVNKEGGGF
ncbi:MAG: DUF3417 domain-containing protein [Bacteroidota bacterium]